MGNLSTIGRVFFGIAIAALGAVTIYHRDFPYMLIPPKHSWLSAHILLVYLSGALLFLAGGCIALGRWLKPIALGLGTVLLLVFCFYFIPYELFRSSNHMHFGDWENAAKELALAAGAFAVAGSRSKQIGTILFSLTIISFSIDHFLYAKEAAGYVPSWVANPVTWLYITGAALLGSGLAILFSIKPRLAAALLGTMIFIWVIILHIPKVVAGPYAGSEGEVTSAFLALAYCGIAFVIAGTKK